MTKFSFALLASSLLVGCVEPPVPTGPAAEAPTDAIEITMDDSGTQVSSATTTPQE